jgi:hypothetical protein
MRTHDGAQYRQCETGPSLGDQFLFSGDLTRQGQQVGHAGVICPVTSLATEERLCVGSFSFDNDGEITVQGLYAGAPQVYSLPITGGSRAYKDAAGEVQVQELGSHRSRLIFHLHE